MKYLNENIRMVVLTILIVLTLREPTSHWFSDFSTALVSHNYPKRATLWTPNVSKGLRIVEEWKNIKLDLKLTFGHRNAAFGPPCGHYGVKQARVSQMLAARAPRTAVRSKTRRAVPLFRNRKPTYREQLPRNRIDIASTQRHKAQIGESRSLTKETRSIVIYTLRNFQSRATTAKRYGKNDSELRRWLNSMGESKNRNRKTTTRITATRGNLALLPGSIKNGGEGGGVRRFLVIVDGSIFFFFFFFSRIEINFRPRFFPPSKNSSRSNSVPLVFHCFSHGWRFPRIRQTEISRARAFWNSRWFGGVSDVASGKQRDKVSMLLLWMCHLESKVSTGVENETSLTWTTPILRFRIKLLASPRLVNICNMYTFVRCYWELIYS